MTDGPDHSFHSEEEETSYERNQQKETIMKKLQQLTQEDDPQARQRLTHEIMHQISHMLRENQEMKEELIAFVKRLKEQ